MNQLLGSMLGKGFITDLHKNAFRPEVLAHAPIRSDAMVRGMDNTHSALVQLEDKMSRVFDALTGKHGVELVTSLSNIVTGVSQLVKIATVISEKLDLFHGIAAATGFIAHPVDSATGAITGLKKQLNAPNTQGAGPLEVFKRAFADAMGANELLFSELIKWSAAPKPPSVPGHKDHPAPNVNVHQTNHFPAGAAHDPNHAAQVQKKAIKTAFRQSAAQGWIA